MQIESIRSTRRGQPAGLPLPSDGDGQPTDNVGVKRKPTFDNEATERRRRIAFALLDTLTKTGSELQPDDVPHMRLVASWYGGKELVDRILAASQQKKSAKNKGMSANFNQLQEEVLLGIAITCLDRLA
jgi:hypothetical protein